MILLIVKDATTNGETIMLFSSLAAGQAHYAEQARIVWLQMKAAETSGDKEARLTFRNRFRILRRLATGR